MTKIFKIRDDIELRTIQISDAEILFNTTKQNNEHLRKWLAWLDDDKTIEDTKAYIKESEERFSKEEGVDFCIWQEGALIGGIGLYPWDKTHKKTSISYWLTKESEGKGIMTDCLRTVLEYAFTEMKVNRIEISCGVGNIKSSALPKKLGFTFEGIAREANWIYDHPVDLEVYSLLNKEWKV